MSNNQKLNIIKNLFKAITIFFIGFLLVGLFVSKYSVGFNNSESISGKVFFVIKNSFPEKESDKIIFKVNNIHTNNEDQNFVKKVVGFAGDVISIKNNKIFLNGNYLGNIKSKSINNNPLYPILENDQSIKIPHNQYFIYSSHKDSYDSRYQSLGLIEESKIIGRAYEIF